AEGMTVKEIVRRVGASRNHVRDVIRNGCGDVFRSRQTSLAPYLAALDAEWMGGCHRGAELWRRLRRLGFPGSLRVVTEWATRRKRSEKAGLMGLGRVPSARVIARLMSVMRDALSKSDATMMAAIEAGVPSLVMARDLLLRFQAIVRSRTIGNLQAWIDAARDSLMSSFAVGLAADQVAVAAALTEPWSNGQTEGQITKLKLVKRQMYGRANLDLLRARLVGELHAD
ncbi:transposase, partial [Beijerinckia sp. L45]|uniref:transposase n=1 Tax=Beijerinckia sp. L45 TaxID=1641855 RepID=UPI001AEDF541